MTFEFMGSESGPAGRKLSPGWSASRGTTFDLIEAPRASVFCSIIVGTEYVGMSVRGYEMGGGGGAFAGCGRRPVFIRRPDAPWDSDWSEARTTYRHVARPCDPLST